MPNNIAISITADVADLTVKRAILSSELKAAQRDLTNFAKTARESGSTDALRTSMLGAADAAGKARNSVALVDRELRGLSGGAEVAAGAMTTVSHGSSTVTRELLVLAREAGRGNFTRMAGSATILAGALGLMTPAILTAAAVIVSLAVPFLAFGAAALSASEDAAHFANAIQITGDYADLTSTAYEAMARRVATASNTGVGTARGALLALASSGRFAGVEIEQLGRDGVKFGELTGESAKKVLAGWVKMADGPSRFAETFNATYHALSLAQVEHIADLEHEGQTSQATAALVQDLTQWLDQQAVHLGMLGGAWHGLTSGIDGAWEAMKRFTNAGTTGQQLGGVDAQLARLRSADYQREHVGGASGARAVYQEQIAVLERTRAALAAKGAAEQRASDATAAATRVQADGQEAYDKSHATLQGLRSSALQASDAIKTLHEQMAARLKANPADTEAKDYYAHQSRIDAALRHKEDPTDNKKPKQAPKSKDEQVQVWRQELQAQLEAEHNFFADSKQQERDFWQSKLALTKAGSEAQRSVKTQIYDLDRELAQQTYRSQIGRLDEQLAAERESWAQEQSLMDAKLIFIRLNQGQQSEAYAAAERERDEMAQRHQETQLENSKSTAAEALAELKANLAAQKTVRDADARSHETAIRSGPGNSGPLGKASADVQIAALHQQTLAKQMAADRVAYAAEDQLLQREVAQTLAAEGEMSRAHIEAVNAKTAADNRYANQQKVLADEALNQARADTLKLQATWHQTVDPMVNVTAQGIRGLLTGTETWHQALVAVGGEAISLIISGIERMIAQWLVNMIVGKAATAAVSASSVASYAGIAGAAGVASMAGAPFPLDLSAPAFGASMAASALAFGAFDRGMNVVPQDMIAQIHAGERIIPKAENSMLMARLADGGGGQGASQTVTNNYSPTIHTQGQADFGQMLEDHGHVMLAMMKRAARDGKLRSLMA